MTMDVTEPLIEQEHQFSLVEGVYKLRKQFVLHSITYSLKNADTDPLSVDINPITNKIEISIVDIKQDKCPLKIKQLFEDKNLLIQDEVSLDQINDIETFVSSDDTDLMKDILLESKNMDEYSLLSANLSSNQISFTGNVSETSKDNNTMKSYNPLNLKSLSLPSKKLKPKNSILKTSSSFISRIILHDDMIKCVASKTSDIIYIFSNVEKVFNWIGIFPDAKEEFISKIIFSKAHITCHDANQFTKSINQIDTVFGFSTSDIIWFDPISTKYTHLNKQGIVNSSPVNCIKWIPRTENLFIVAHNDGSLIIYNKEKEKCFFAQDDNCMERSDSSEFKVLKSLSDTENQRHNPISYWQFYKHSPTSLAFSPVSCHIAVVFSNGTLKLIDYKNEKHIDTYNSWYGGLICVSWSPNGQYILTGGEDDLVTVWSFLDRKIVYRCQGHQSWVTGVSFDPWRCNKNHYRFGSVGEDGRLLLWEFDADSLDKTKDFDQSNGHSPLKNNHKTITTPFLDTKTQKDSLNTSSEPLYHAPMSYASVSILSPIMSKIISDQSLSGLVFCQNFIVISGKKDFIQIWDRP
ncbi:hypothetical protein T552_03367 [Pneumocystis carinii B80]|uniref:Uncharacterized protein n=1 Tax=Pneumocystis carinii (strain B80) TaxID=1408658 RepID=A0A0W4ZBF9_PNEC8|nr:hypothetical protein T552_03367 [Pneumocystis carinii B80]KTW25754.1 hypothetical protein T552_03367 [Pneumocystis carinii B80]